MKLTKSFLFLSVSAISIAAQGAASSPNVYPGCEKINYQIERSVTFNGNKGEFLQDAFDKKLIHRGDRITVTGPQKSLYLNINKLKYLDDGTNKWITIIGSNATFDNVSVIGMKRIYLRALKMVNTTGSSKTLFASAKNNNVVLSHSTLTGAVSTKGFTAANWIGLPSGISSDTDNCVSFYGNNLTNMRHGISVSTRGLTDETAVVNALVEENTLKNLSGDFMRPIGSNISLLSNKGYDGYVGAADGDGNHDDFIQGFALNGVEFTNVMIKGNFFNEITNPKRAFKSSYQGISVFDGVYKNFEISKNTIIASAYHGITMMGAQDGLIANNTIVNNLQGGNRKLWISTPTGKHAQPSRNVVVKNNLTNYIHAAVETKFINNAVILSSVLSKHVVKFDTVNLVFDLNFLKTSPFYGKSIGSGK